MGTSLGNGFFHQPVALLWSWPTHMMAVTGLQIQRSGSNQKKISDFLQA